MIHKGGCKSVWGEGGKKGEGNYKHEESNVHLANLAQLKVIFCASLKFLMLGGGKIPPPPHAKIYFLYPTPN